MVRRKGELNMIFLVIDNENNVWGIGDNQQNAILDAENWLGAARGSIVFHETGFKIKTMDMPFQNSYRYLGNDKIQEMYENYEKGKMKMKIYGEYDEDMNVRLFYEDGVSVNRLDDVVYPVGSNVSALYEHPEGIVLSKSDAEKLKIEIVE
jgi:hypothetical protein